MIKDGIKYLKINEGRDSIADYMNATI